MGFKSAKNGSDLNKTLQLLHELARYTVPSDDSKIRARIGFAFSCLVFSKGANLLTPLFYGATVDLVNSSSGFAVTAFFFLVGGYALARLGQVVFNEAKQYLFAKVAQRAVRGAALQAFRHLHSLSLKFHMDRQTGGLSRAIDRGAKAIEFLLTMAFFEVLPLFIEVVFVTILMWYMFGGFYAAVTFITVVIYVYFTVLVTEWRIRFRREANIADETAASRAVDSLLNFETVKYFNAEDVEASRYDAAMKNYEKMAVRSRTSLSVVNIGQGGIIAVGLVLVMTAAGTDIQEGSLSVGDFVAINTFLLQLYLPLNFLGWVYREIRQGLVDMERMFGLLNEKTDVFDTASSKNLKVDGGKIVFKDVCFDYDGRMVLNGVSFTVPAGGYVAIVGPSGSGKTTISRLLFRFYDPISGSIFIDGQNIRDVKQSSLRAAIGIVPQDTVMFNASIYYNIAYGREGASKQEIISAAKSAAIEKFISKLPNGYKTLVGERGLKLSGGEKQRVAIARSILKKPDIFLFDEATSALDSRTEKEIQVSIDSVSKNRTTLVIAHRLSTIVNADEIFVLESGKIVEHGSHGKLLAQNGLYSKMWERQSFSDVKISLSKNN